MRCLIRFGQAEVLHHAEQRRLKNAGRRGFRGGMVSGTNQSPLADEKAGGHFTLRGLKIPGLISGWSGGAYSPNTHWWYLPGFLPSAIPGVKPIQYNRPWPSLSLTIKLIAMTLPGWGGSIPSSRHGIAAS